MMKKLLIFFAFIISFFVSFSQVPATPFPVTQGLGAVNTLVKNRGGFKADSANILPTFLDTIHANYGPHPKFYPGNLIFTTTDTSIWYRNTTATKWIKVASTANLGFGIIFDTTCNCFRIDTTLIGGTIINNIFNNSITEIHILNQVDSSISIEICTGANACDTFNFITNLGDTAQTIGFIGDSLIVVCRTDTAGGVATVHCDTLSIPKQKLYVFQNWTYQPVAGLVEAGTMPLVHNTDFSTQYFTATMGGFPVYSYPINFYQQQFFSVGTGITSYHSIGNNIIGQPDYFNKVKLGINYTGAVYPASPSNLTGYMNNKIGYWIGVNATGNGSYGLRTDTSLSKIDGIFFHTVDTSNHDAITFFGKHPPNPNYQASIATPGGTLEQYRIMILNDTGDVRVPHYPNTRNNGTHNNSFFTDNSGNVKYGPNSAGSTVTIIDNSHIQICSGNNSNNCDTFLVNSPTNILGGTVTILSDTSLLICDTAQVCDTFFIPSTSFVASPIIIQNTLWVAKNGNDAQGIRNRVDKPYLTIEAAYAAAQNGDVIKVFPGIYEMAATLTLNKNVSFHFTGKGRVRLNTGVATALFIDGGGGNVVHFDAPGWTFEGRGTQRVFNLTGTDTLTIIADNLFASSVPTIETTTSGAAILVVNVDSAYSYSGSKTCIRQTNGLMYLTANVVMNYQGSGTDNSSIYLLGSANSWIRVKKIESAGAIANDYAVLGGSLTAASRVYIDADLIKSVNDWAIFPTSATPINAEWHCKAKRIENTSDCTVVSGINDFTVQADEIVNNSNDADIDGICHAEGGILYLIGARIVRTGTTGSVGRDLLTTAGGKVFYEGVAYKQNAVHEETPGDIKKMDSLSYGSRFRYTNSRMETDTTLATAANNLVLGKGNVVRVSGNTQINAIDSTEWQPGSVVRLIFSGTPIVKNNTSGGAGTIPIKLAGGVDFNAAAGDVLTLVDDSQFWRESARTVTASVGGVTADNGLTINPAGNVQLGSTSSFGAPLLHDTHIGSNGFVLTLEQATGTNGQMVIRNQETASTSIGINLYVENRTQSPLASTIFAQNSGGGTALYAGQGGAPNANTASLRVESASSSAGPIIAYCGQFLSSTNGGAVNGNGTGLEFRTGTTVVANNNPGSIMGNLSYKWVDATHASRMAQMDLQLSNIGSVNTIMSAYASGVVGIGISSGYTATRLNIVDNGLAGANMVDLTSTSTAAASSAQKLLNISLSGANANGSETTYGAYVTNIHTGTTPVNIGIYSSTNNGTSSSTAVYGEALGSGIGVRGVATNGNGVQGNSSSGTGVSGFSTTGFGVQASSPVGAGSFISSPSSTNSMLTVVQIQRNSSGTPAPGMGGRINFELGSSTNVYRTAANIGTEWVVATDGSQTSLVRVEAVNAAVTTTVMKINGDGSWDITPITATAASAITPSEGKIVFVSTTDATFISIGFWGYQNGAWHAF